MPGLNELLVTNKKFTAGTVVNPAGISALKMNIIDYPRIPTGIFPLDYSLAGGIPCNVITQLYGPNQGGKTTLSYLIAKSLASTCTRCLKPKAMCKCPEGPKHSKTFLAHFEGMPPDELYFQTLGYDTTENMIVGLPEYGEQGCTMIEAAVKSDDCGLIIVDSLATIVPKEELECDYEDAKVALQARLIKRLFNRLNVLLTKEFRRGHLVGVIFINQIRTIIGAGRFEPSETVPGGHTAKHGYRLSMRVNQLGLDGDKGEIDKSENMKNVLRFSASLLGPSAKQQMLLLAGKCEYKIALRDYKGYEPGTPLDAGACAGIAKDIGMLEKDGKHYALGKTGMRFRVLSDIDRLFQTGEYVNPDTGEVLMTGADTLMRYAVLRHSVALATRAVLERSEQKLQRIGNPNEGGCACPPPPDPVDPEDVSDLDDTDGVMP